MLIEQTDKTADGDKIIVISNGTGRAVWMGYVCERTKAIADFLVNFGLSNSEGADLGDWAAETCCGM